MFKSPKPPPAPKPPPPVPTVDEAAVRAEDEMRLRRRKGRRAFVMAGKTPQAAPVVGRNTLTGQ